jgi:hypothetical protein
MAVPYFVLIGPYFAGLLTAGGLLIWMHVLMLPAMLVAMLLRRHEYSQRPRKGDSQPKRAFAAWRFQHRRGS